MAVHPARDKAVSAVKVRVNIRLSFPSLFALLVFALYCETRCGSVAVDGEYRLWWAFFVLTTHGMRITPGIGHQQYA
jgi:hypothetical protein